MLFLPCINFSLNVVLQYGLSTLAQSSKLKKKDYYFL